MAWRDGLIVLVVLGAYLLWLRAFIGSHPVGGDARMGSRQLRRTALRVGR